MSPHHEIERWQIGRLVVGVDEAGRGALAGPVAAAAVVFPSYGIPEGLNDSKALTAEQRGIAAQRITKSALAWSVALVHHDRIDLVNILQATFDAMHAAIDDVISQLNASHELELLIDGNRFRPHALPSTTIVRGDAICPSIAAASILAKTTRDQWMLDIDRTFPSYGFAAHKGYATKVHRASIISHGPCPIHRMTFLRTILGNTQPRVTHG